VASGDAIGSQHDATDDPVMQSLYQALSENGVRLTIRRGILRIAMHLYNNEDDVDGFLSIARSWRDKQVS
jgi:cysteine desulfurase/selenocysteine lyase